MDTFGFYQLERDLFGRQSPDLIEDSVISSIKRAFNIVQDTLKYP